MITAQRVAKNTTVLLLSRIFSIGLGIVYVAVLARYIHAAGMGKIATATSLVSILILLPIFGLNDLIVRDVAGDRAKTSAYFSNVLLLRGLLSIAFGLVLFGVTKIIEYPYDTTLVIYLYGLSYVVDNFTDVVFSLFNAFEQMEYPAILQMGRDLFNIVVSLGAIYLHADLIAIVVISAVACVLKLLASIVVLRWRFIKPRWHIDQQLCRRLIVAALPFATLGVIALISRQIDVVLLSLFHSEEEVGWFSAANTLVSYLLVVPAVIMQVIFPLFARLHTNSQDNLREAYQASFKYLLLLGFPLCIGTMVTADKVIALVYGPGFENAVVVLQILACLLLWMFGFANGALLNATGGQGILAALTGAAAALNIVIAIFLIPPLSFVGAGIAAVAPGAIFSVPIALICNRRIGTRLPYALALKAFIASLLMGGGVTLCQFAQLNLFLIVLVIAPLVYGLSLGVLRSIDQSDIILFKQMFKNSVAVSVRRIAG